MHLASVEFTPTTRSSVIERLRFWLRNAESGHHIITLNPEYVVEASANQTFANIINRSSLVTVDGIGVLLAQRLKGNRHAERVTGNDLIELLGQLSTDVPVRLFLYGARPGVAQGVAQTLSARFRSLKVVGAESGVRGDGRLLPTTVLLDRIRRSRANCVLVALGSPKQEYWIAEHLASLPDVTLAIGVGGSFDYLAGTIRRAPQTFRILGLEWLWRFFHQPWRYRRIINATLVFPWKVLTVHPEKNK